MVVAPQLEAHGGRFGIELVAAGHGLALAGARIELGGDALAEFGTDGPTLDQRFKLVFPNAAGRLPSVADATEEWWTTWEAQNSRLSWLTRWNQ